MILTMGEIVIDCFARPQENFTMGMEATVGGSPLNVAVVLQRLGTDAGMLGAVSTDRLGRMVRAKMQHEDLAMDYLQSRDLPSTIALVSPDKEGQAHYSFIKENPADLAITINDLPARLPANIDAVHFGSYAVTAEPLATALRALVWRESGRKFMAYDLNVRPSVQPDMRLWRERTESLVGYCSLVKASDEDIAMLYPTDNPDDVMDRWLSAGVSFVVITRGEKGLIGKTKTVSARVQAVKQNIVDTVGAGDTVQGALLHGLQSARALNRGKISSLTEVDLHKLLGFAAHAASITCSRQGAEPPYADELS